MKPNHSDPGRDLSPLEQETLDLMNRWRRDRLLFTVKFRKFEKHLAMAATHLRPFVEFEGTPLPAHPHGDLDNDIHPVLQRKKFYFDMALDPAKSETQADVVWQRLQPSLRLASKFITTPELMDWWMHALLGSKTKNPTKKHPYLSPPLQTKDAGIHRVVRHLSSMASDVHWLWSELPNNIHAHTGWSPHLGKSKVFIELDIGYLRYMLAEDYTEKLVKEPCNTVRVNWGLAMVLVHELAHAFYALREDVTAQRVANCETEPLFAQTDFVPELGWSWERSILGSGAANWPHSERGVTAVSWTPYMGISDIRQFRFGRYQIGTHFLHSFFLQDSWQKFHDASSVEKKSFWHVKDGKSLQSRIGMSLFGICWKKWTEMKRDNGSGNGTESS